MVLLHLRMQTGSFNNSANLRLVPEFNERDPILFSLSRNGDQVQTGL